MNVYGFFENLAWAFVHHHGLEGQIGKRTNIGLFLKSTQIFLPEVLAKYLRSKTIVTWHDEYLKNYRDALAHRILLYIPPLVLRPGEDKKFKELEIREIECIRNQCWDQLEELREQQANLGVAAPMFLHSFSEGDKLRPVYLHPQMLCDAMTVVEFGNLFFENWTQRA
jgi:hypothetical protein